MQPEVAIVGGGLAGLVVARSLRKAGTGFTLLEARLAWAGRHLVVDDRWSCSYGAVTVATGLLVGGEPRVLTGARPWIETMKLEDQQRPISE
ncbi:NAD(P)-binding protein [Nitrosospira multiformis]|uniref:NAD(P)-binding Rossmann-like domain-containing protein n=1 Tax=Nitrosospira multiformis TaxID=1231 RepID=A0A1I7GVY1_9PROT|nr:NAD(P)-binding protein [Nitrosospira multiformis]SFU52581.1 NAD(P)-binding Rossmann-like domain-containing protein [Nitrosospira multiformis]